MVKVLFILFIILLLFYLDLSVKFYKLKKEVRYIEPDINTEINRLKKKIYSLENPEIYKYGDTLFYYDENICDKVEKCKCLGLARHEYSDDLQRYYYIEFNNKVYQISDKYLNKNKDNL